MCNKSRAAQSYTPERSAPTTATAATTTNTTATTPTGGAMPFCHAFDLTKRLTIPSTAKLTFIPPPPPSTQATNSASPYTPILTRLAAVLSASPSPVDAPVHRVVIPSLLNPALYPPHACQPTHLLQFMHALRALLRAHPRQLTLLISLPTELYPRDTGLVRWMEILADGVVELLPLPRRTAAKGGAATAGGGQEEPQGLVKLWKLPVLGEKGGGVGAALGAGQDLAFLVTRRRFEIMAYSLPPADDDDHDDIGSHGHGEGEPGRGAGKATKVDLEF